MEICSLMMLDHFRNAKVLGPQPIAPCRDASTSQGVRRMKRTTSDPVGLVLKYLCRVKQKVTGMSCG
jgi:hypothetical protein